MTNRLDSSSDCVAFASTILALLLLGFIPASTVPLIEYGLTPLEISAGRVIIALAVALVVMACRDIRSLASLSPSELVLTLGVGGCSLITSLGYSTALASMSVAASILVVFSAAPLVAYLLDRRVKTPAPVIVITVCAITAGLGLASGVGSQTISVGGGVLAAVLTGIVFGAYPKAVDQTGTMCLHKVIFASFLISAVGHLSVFILPQQLVGSPVNVIAALAQPVPAVLLLLNGILFCYAPYALLGYARRNGCLSQTAMAVMFAIEPAVAIVVSAAVLDQEIGVGVALGSIATVIAVTAFAIHLTNNE